MKRTKLNAVLIGLALIVFGVILFAYPVTTIATVLRVIGIGLLLVGAIGIAAFFASKEETKSLRSLLVGIVEVVIGLVFLANPAFIASIYPVILGIVIVLDGLGSLIAALQMKKAGAQRWSLAAVLSAVTIIMGAIILFNPFSTAVVLIKVTGAVLCYDGIVGVIMALIR